MSRVTVPIEIVVHHEGIFSREIYFFFTNGETLWPCQVNLAGDVLTDNSAASSIAEDDAESRGPVRPVLQLDQPD